MKTLARTAVILIAALVVVGALFALSQTSFASSMFGGAAGAGEMMRGQMTSGQMPAGFAGGHENEGSGASIIGLLPIFKNAAIMGALTLMVLLSSFIPKLGRRRAHPTRA